MNSMVWGIAIVLVSALSAIAFPFATYAITLATFGIAHVAIELRYIDSRFHQNLNGTLETRLLQLVLAIAGWRCLSIFGFMPAEIAHLLELFCGLGLVVLATHYLFRRNWRLGTIGLAVGGLLGIGILKDPIATSVILAIAHNLTPIGFILERQRRSIRTVFTCVLVFGLLPILIFLFQLFANLPLSSSPNYLSAFIAPSWHPTAIAYPLFSAVTFLQCMHYAVVIGLFSLWTSDRTQTFFPWFPSKYFYGMLGGLTIYFLFAFQYSFFFTRAIYGIVASIHAWLEIPLLLLLLIPLKAIENQTTGIGSEISPKG